MRLTQPPLQPLMTASRCHFMRSNVFWRSSRSEALPVFSRLLSIHLGCRYVIRGSVESLKREELQHSHYFILSNVFWRSCKSEALPVFSRLLSIHFFSSAFLVGRSDW
jgi:hypothetical protein